MAIISFEHVSKRFILHHEKRRSFQDMFVHALRRNGGREEFWALRDVSFELEKGQTIGIIGKNGAGKSTILKLVTRILQPTSGRIRIDGKVSALLELGAGFEGELSGRDNIYLNGSIYGFSRKQMDAKYEQIVEFSELGRFIDTPIKHYSSGMFMRLGFSVAIAMDPDILVVDEILAVGDARFQQKCIDSLFRLKDEGKSLLFVSHDIISVRRFCDKVLLLSAGREVAYGRADEVIDEYVYKTSNEPLNGSGREEKKDEERDASGAVIPTRARVDAVRFLKRDGQESDVFVSGDPIDVEISYSILEELKECIIGILFFNEEGVCVCGNDTEKDELTDLERSVGSYTVRYHIPRFRFTQGRFYVSVGLADHSKSAGQFSMLDHHHRRYTFELISTRLSDGLCLIDHSWTVPGMVEPPLPPRSRT
jgi:lipopolysaccharide transport system ATP-binding protein